MSAIGRLGVGLWTFQSTASAPASLHDQYRAFAEDAALLERLGFHSAWTAEHRGWYDGWCPAPLHALALAVAHTERLRFGTAMLLLAQRDPAAVAEAAARLDQLSGGRVDLGVGLGHRDAEFDMLGLRRDRRGRLMDHALDVLAEAWPGLRPVQSPGPPLWIGGLAPATLARARTGGHRLMLPQSLRPDELARIAAEHRAAAGDDAVVGVMRDVWVGADDRRAARLRARIRRHYQEEAGAWWLLGGEIGFTVPDRLKAQLERLDQCALIGPPEAVAEGLDALLATADLVVIRPVFDVVSRAELHEQLRLVACDVAPTVTTLRAAAGAHATPPAAARGGAPVPEVP
jgi:alkanesulfonate monooxygenase SsuD/methylene tetrahydromethanopterin reductase-like flavin-dependent oxidoreductase (luciferase family)